MRLVIYTAIIGNRDHIHRPVKSTDATFICFTDRPDAHAGHGWQIETVEMDGYPATVDGWTRRARKLKILAHETLPEEFDYSIWVDSSRQIKSNLAGLAERSGKFGIFHHYRHDRTVEGEAWVCSMVPRDDPEVIGRHMSRYSDRILGKSVLMTTYLMRAHRDPVVIDLMESWWHELDTGSRRDQLSLPYVLDKHDFEPRVFPGGSDRKYFIYRGHSRK